MLVVTAFTVSDLLSLNQQRGGGRGGVKLLPHIRLRLIDSNFIIARCKLIYPLVIYLFLLCFCDILVAFNAF